MEKERQTTSECLIFSGCYEFNTTFPFGQAEVSFIEHVYSREECQYKCQQIPTCNFFTFVPKNPALNRHKSVCYPKFGITSHKQAAGCISGPKYCTSSNSTTDVAHVNYLTKSFAGQNASGGIPRQSYTNNSNFC